MDLAYLRLLSASGVLRLLLACACASPAWAQPVDAAQADAPYRIARGDELSLRFFYTPELNTVATVRSDGRVGIPLIGEMVVEGLTPAELSTAVVERLGGLVRRPEMVVNVQGAGSQRVFVGGEVGRPGVQPLVGPLSTVQAVMVAEGLKDTAKASEAVLIRRGSDGGREVLKVNLADALAGNDARGDLPLRPYDVLVVPKSGIANVNVWVDQYLRRNLPISLGVTYSIYRPVVAP